ncbi:unnamed protein product [Blepharisma stoltei]|uniref:Protein tyrosine phosphatase n=1 Tax=Blepharisma stoltei TaxID=1481888 RepID=A0AAU9K031_9CILI|nr:unnamed protein product [Blepharisma stoltei]
MDIPILGFHSKRDLSSRYLIKYPEIVELEAGIPYKEFFYHSRARDKNLEFRVVKRITETKQHAELLIENSALTCPLNRYADILPYRDTIVPLSYYLYINASFIDGSIANSEQMFIATQGPLRCTMDAFWSMIWEYNVSLIIMMCSVQEGGVSKCEEYFPTKCSIHLIEFEITLIKKVNRYSSLIERTLLVTHIPSDECKIITHLQSTSWPDQGVPKVFDEFSSINYMISMIKKKRQGNSKIAVHCSAGIGRTGVLIGLNNLVAQLDERLCEELYDLDTDPTLSIFGTVRKLREQRWGMVATAKQYKFMYKFMEYWIASFLAYKSQFKRV